MGVPYPLSSQLEGTSMSFQSAVENSGLKKSRGRSEGSLTQWNFQVPLREATNEDAAVARAAVSVGKGTSVACAGSRLTPMARGSWSSGGTFDGAVAGGGLTGAAPRLNETNDSRRA